VHASSSDTFFLQSSSPAEKGENKKLKLSPSIARIQTQANKNILLEFQKGENKNSI